MAIHFVTTTANLINNFAILVKGWQLHGTLGWQTVVAEFHHHLLEVLLTPRPLLNDVHD